MGEEFELVRKFLGPLDGQSKSKYEYPAWAKVMKAKLDAETEPFDWMLAAITDYDPLRTKEIRRSCSPSEIAKAYAMKAYSNSASPK